MTYDEQISAPGWSVPRDHPALGERDLHIWRAPLDVPLASIERRSQLLSPDEVARADQFHFDIDRNHFIVGRALLRIILGRYLRVDPAELRFGCGSHGKPSLADTFKGGLGVNFNLAHSGELAIYGITLGRQIGIDLEEIRPEFAGEEIAKRFFSSSEVARLFSLPAVARGKAFFDCWTRKEAFIKAKGGGLSIALDQFDVTLGAEEPALLLRTAWDENEADRWSLKSISVDPDYAAAVAVEGRDLVLSCWSIGSMPDVEQGLLYSSRLPDRSTAVQDLTKIGLPTARMRAAFKWT
jgi:4'-phosphopantetheinyl transferase